MKAKTHFTFYDTIFSFYLFPFTFFLLPFSFLALCGSPALAETPRFSQDYFRWDTLPPIPASEGRSAPLAGISQQALIVAGGVSGPLVSGSPDSGKRYHDEIFVLDDPQAAWKVAGSKLPRPLAHGVSITAGESVKQPYRGLICLGGSDGRRAWRDVFCLRWANGRIERTDLPRLPRPVTGACGGLLGTTIYIAGGCAGPDPRTSESTHTFWALDLNDRKPAWREEELWPGPPRTHAVAAVQDGSLLLLGGVSRVRDNSGKLRVDYLTDAYRYHPKPGSGKKHWRKIADLPAAHAGAPSPAPALGQSHVILLGGIVGPDADDDPDVQLPKLRDTTWAYHTITNTWVQMGQLTEPRIVVPVVKWNGRFVLPGGRNPSGQSATTVTQAATTSEKTDFGKINYLVLTVYLLSLVAIGLYFSKREKGAHDFFLGGQRVPWWAAGLSIYGTMLSAITFMTMPAIAFAGNWIRLVSSFSIFLIAPTIIYFYLPFFRRLRVTTAYEYLEARFNLAVRLLGSALFVLFQVGRMGIVLFLPALALSSVTGMDKFTCIVVMGILSTTYTVLGGIEAVIWTDVLQVIVLMGGAIIIVLVAASQIDGGMMGVIAAGHIEGKFHLADWNLDATTTAIWVIFFGGLCEMLYSYSSDQTIVQRYLTTKDEKMAARSIWTNAALIIPGAFVFFFMGTALYVFYQAHPGQLNPTLQNDALVPLFISQHLPPGISGLVIAGIFAASMSSLDSSMNSMSTAVVTDFYKRFKTGVSDHASLIVARFLTVLFGIFGTASALALATYDIRSLLDQYQTFLGLFAGGLGGMFALGIFTRRAHGLGGLVGLLASTVIQYLVANYTSIHFLLYAVTGVVSSFVIGYLASLILPSPQKSIEGLTIYTIAPSDAG